MVSTRVASTVSLPDTSFIAGSVLPIQRAEELLATLPGIISARIVASGTGAVDEIHILTTTDVTPKQTVRNVESALIAHLGMRVSHKKISVATSDEGQRPQRNAASTLHLPPTTPPAPATVSAPVAPMRPTVVPNSPAEMAPPVVGGMFRRRIYFEDVEVRRSRAKGVACRVTLRKGEQSFIGESEGLETERLRIEL